MDREREKEREGGKQIIVKICLALATSIFLSGSIFVAEIRLRVISRS